MIVSAIWNIGQPFYSAIVSTIIENYKDLFHNTDEAYKIFSMQVESSITEYFAPTEREDQ